MEELVLVNVELFSDDSDDEIEDDFNLILRKPYTIRQRPNHLEYWDDEEFRCRFRLTKNATMYVLQQIENFIRFPTER